MIVALCSDLHLEHALILPSNTEGAKVLILAGDIMVLNDLEPKDEPLYYPRSHRIHKFFRHCAEQFEHIIYVGGNHEFYHSDINNGMSKAKTLLSYITNLTILENSCVEIDDIIFAGGTLWTDMKKGCPITIEATRHGMADFRVINRGMTKYTPFNSTEEFNRTFAYLNAVTIQRPDSRFVVVTHHAPSHGSIHEKYLNASWINGAFASDLDQFIHDKNNIAVWCHGHMHDKFDYMVGDTRVICNPRGYPGENPEFEVQYFDLSTIEE